MATQYTGGLTAGQILTAATMNSIGAAWETWTPTVTSSGGTLTSTTVNSARYSQVQKIITCTFDISITSVGSGSGSLRMTLPVTASSSWAIGGGCGTWREKNVTGDMGFIVKESTTMVSAQKYDQSAILNTGRQFLGTFTYEAA